MRVLKYILIILLPFSKLLTYSQDCDRIDTLFLFESNSFEKELKKGEILSKIVDTIKSEATYNEFAWRIEETVDSISQKINVQLLLDQSYYCYDWSIKEQNIFAIELSRFDSIFVEGTYTNKIDTLDKSIIEFITNPEDKPNLPQKRLKYINFFDTVLITRHEFLIIAVMVADSNGVSSSWDKLNSLINKILICYLELRNDLAIETWKMPYKKLEFDKRVSITKYYPINLWIFPNRERVKPPPPPPYEQTEQYIIDSITNSYLKELEERFFKIE